VPFLFEFCYFFCIVCLVLGVVCLGLLFFFFFYVGFFLRCFCSFCCLWCLVGVLGVGRCLFFFFILLVCFLGGWGGVLWVYVGFVCDVVFFLLFFFLLGLFFVAGL